MADEEEDARLRERLAAQTGLKIDDSLIFGDLEDDDSQRRAASSSSSAKRVPERQHHGGSKRAELKIDVSR